MKKHILLTDDEATIRDLLAKCLSDRGYQISTASSGAEAMKVVRHTPPDLLICDLQLEDADGLELIAKIKEIIPTAPVILLTGVLFDPEVVRDVLSKNVACYLEKTSSLAKILETVDRLLGEGKPPGGS